MANALYVRVVANIVINATIRGNALNVTAAASAQTAGVRPDAHVRSVKVVAHAIYAAEVGDTT